MYENMNMAADNRNIMFSNQEDSAKSKSNGTIIKTKGSSQGNHADENDIQPNSNVFNDQVMIHTDMSICFHCSSVSLMLYTHHRL